tara:strand:- start:31 stop:288 length:258 start_codon:yes stop_codon:yes gene_type:complete
MVADELLALIQERAADIKFSVNGEGKNFSIEAISERFENMSRLQRQKEVFKLIKDLISDGTLHAISINAFTPEELRKLKTIEGFN